MLANSGEPALPPLLLRLLGSMVALECQPNEQLRSAQIGPPPGGRIQGDSKVVGLSHEVTRTSSRHAEV